MLEDRVAELDGILRESIAAVDLNPDAARREVADNPCIGPGGTGKNLRYYFAEPSHDRGVGYLQVLEQYWGSTERFQINDPLQDDGNWATLLAVSGQFSVGADWFPYSKELVVGGSTPCVG